MKIFFQQTGISLCIVLSKHFETVGKTLTDIQYFDIVESCFLNQLALVHQWNYNMSRNNM